jgi:hypothetical protein
MSKEMKIESVGLTLDDVGMFEQGREECADAIGMFRRVT